MAKHNRGDLQQMQSLPLEAKIIMTEQRIRVWVDAWKRYEIVNKKTGRKRYVTDTEEPTEKGHWIKKEVKKGGVITVREKMRKGTKLKANEYVSSVESEKAYISRSGGKDSDVLGDIAKRMGLNIEQIFINTGLEDRTVRRHGENVADKTLHTSMPPIKILQKYGYHVISKDVAQCIYELQVARNNKSKCEKSYRMKKLDGTLRKKNGELSQFNMPQWKFLLYAPFRISHMCCDESKKKPAKKYEKESGNMPIIGTMAEESRNRESKWLNTGCNAFELDRPTSQPLSFWTEQDILQYIATRGIRIAEAYGEVEYDGKKYKTTKTDRTGCVFCLFGITRDKERIARLQINDPQLADYVLRGGEFGEDGYWKPSKIGLGYWFVIEWLNTHGLDIKYYDYGYQKEYGTPKTTKLLLNEKIKTRMKRSEKDDRSN